MDSSLDNVLANIPRPVFTLYIYNIDDTHKCDSCNGTLESFHEDHIIGYLCPEHLESFKNEFR